MFSKTTALQMALVSCAALACLLVMTRLISAQPMAGNVNVFPDMLNKINDLGKPAGVASDESAVERSFKDFINSKPTESTIIGEIKPNASALDLMLLRNKIANTIMSMQEKDKQTASLHQQQLSSSSSSSSSESGLAGAQAECYIEVTKVEKVPGKCHRASSGLPICQSDNYMTISNECS